MSLAPLLGLWRLALRDLARRPAAALVLVVGLAVGVSGVLALRVGTEGALASMRDMYASASGPADLVLLPAGDPGEPLPDGIAARVAADPDVVVILPLVSVYAARLEDAARGGLPFLPGPDAAVLVLGADDPCPAEPCRWRRVSGGSPGVLVGEAWAASRKIAVGGPLNLIDRKGAVHPWKVAGTVSREGLGALGYGRVVIAPAAEVRAAFGLPEGAIHEIGVVLRPEADPDRARQRLRAIGGQGVVVTRPSDRGQDVETRLNNLRAGTDLLGMAGLFLAAYLVYGQFSARAAAQARALALLRCAGATRGQVLWTFLLQALALALPGAALGALLGVPLAKAVAGLLALTANADLRLDRVPPTAALGAAALGVLTALLAALWPALRASRAPVWEGLRARAHVAEPPARWSVGLALGVAGLAALSLWLQPSSESVREWTFARILVLLGGIAAALPGLVAPVAGPLSRFAARRLGPAAGLGASSLRWRPARTGLSAGAVLVSVALVGGAAAIGEGVAREVDRWTSLALTWDLYATRVGGFSPEELDEVRQVPGVSRAAGATVRPITVRATGRDAPMPLSAVAVDASTWAEETLVELAPGSGLTPETAMEALSRPDSALVTRVVAAQLGVAPGDTVTVSGRDGPVQVKIAAEIVDYTQNGYSLLVGDVFAREVLGATRIDALAVRVEPGREAEVEAALEARPGVVVEAREGLRARVRALAAAVLVSLDLLAWLSGSIGLLSVGAALAQSAFERRRDLAALAALGATRGQRIGIVVVEGVLTAAIGATLGLLVGAALGHVFSDATSTLGIAVSYVPPWRALIGAAVASLLAAAIAAWIPARRVASVPASEALRTD